MILLLFFVHWSCQIGGIGCGNLSVHTCIVFIAPLSDKSGEDSRVFFILKKPHLYHPICIILFVKKKCNSINDKLLYLTSSRLSFTYFENV